MFLHKKNFQPRLHGLLKLVCDVKLNCGKYLTKKVYSLSTYTTECKSFGLGFIKCPSVFGVTLFRLRNSVKLLCLGLKNNFSIIRIIDTDRLS